MQLQHSQKRYWYWHVCNTIKKQWRWKQWQLQFCYWWCKTGNLYNSFNNKLKQKFHNKYNNDGYELRESIEFYFQQRFSIIIELSSGQFSPAQGPSFFSEDPVFIKNFELCNGVLIENIHIRDFDTDDMQLNGWKNVEMNSIEIGPSRKEEWLLVCTINGIESKRFN